MPNEVERCEERVLGLTREMDAHRGTVNAYWEAQHKWNDLLEKSLDKLVEEFHDCQRRSAASPKSQPTPKALIAALSAVLVGAFELIKFLVERLLAG